MTSCPEPGIYYDIPNAVYQAWNAVSNSRLGWFTKSASTYRYYLANPKDATDEMKIGTAVHGIVLTPGDSDVVVCPEVNRRTKDGKAEWSAFLAENANKTVLTHEQYTKAVEMSQAVLYDPVCANVLAQATEREVSIVFDWPLPDRDPIRCKARIDMALKEIGYIADLKTASDASPDGFSKAIWNWGLYRQAGFYCRGASLAGYMDPEQFLFVTVDSGPAKNPPYNTACYVLDHDAILFGSLEAEDLLCGLSDCIASDTWPSYADEVQSVGLPPWAIRKMRERGYTDIVEQTKEGE